MKIFTIKEVKAAIKEARQIALLDAAAEVASHWNDRNAMVNQYEQAQRSARALQRMAYKVNLTQHGAKRPN